MSAEPCCWEAPVVLTLRGYTPASMNAHASGYRSNWRAASTAKRQCEALLRRALIASDLPLDGSVRAVVADILITFPTHRRRDSDNYRMLISKALGDVLAPPVGHAGPRWLTDDSHEFFRTGIVAIAEDRGVRQTKLRLAWHR